MKNILLLYKKLFTENKTIVLLYLLLLVIVSFILFIVVLEDAARFFDRNEEKIWLYDHLLDDSWLMSLFIISVSLVISTHWGIRHFNYSPQRYLYNTLPVSVQQKFGFIFTYAFILLPVVHVILVCGVYLMASKFNVAGLFNKTPWGLFEDVLHYIKAEGEILFFLKHMYFFIALFVLISLFFNKMGFIKTLVAGLITMLTGMSLYMFMNEKLWDKRGDFGSEQSLTRFPDLYMGHYICLTGFFVAALYTIYIRLTDKNY